jgi:WD40 repeat protein
MESHLMSSQNDNISDDVVEKLNEFWTEFDEFEEKVKDEIHIESVKHFLFRIYIIFNYNMKALDPVKAKEYFDTKLPKFQRGGPYYLVWNEELLNHIADWENKMISEGVPCPTDFYQSIYETKINMSDETWKKIFDIIKTNKARNIHATIIDFPILEQNLNLLIDKLMDYSEDRVKDMSLMKYMISGSWDQIVTWEVSMSGYVAAVGFENGLIKVFKCKIGTKHRADDNGEISEPNNGHKGKYEANREQFSIFMGHKGPVFCISISHDEKLMISGSFDTTIRLWCIPKGEWIWTYKAHQAAVWDIKFFTFSNFFASGSADSLAKMWTVSKFEPVRIFAYHEVDVVKVEFVPKYKSLLTASIDFTMVIWNIVKGQKMIVIDSIKAPIRSLIVTKNWRYLVTGNEYGNLCIYDLNFKWINILNIKHSSERAIWNIDFDQYYKFLAVSDESNIITVYDFKELWKEATINPSSVERESPRHWIIHKIVASTSDENIVYGLRYTNCGIIVGVIKAD